MVSQLSLAKTKLQVTALNGVSLVHLPACLTLSEAISLEETCQNLLLKQPTQIVLDCSQTIFIDSSGVGALINILKPASKQQTLVVLWSVNSRIRAALSLALLNPFLIIDSETEAVPLAAPHQPKVQLLTIHPSVDSRTKRLIDILGALLGLVITAVLFLPIAVAIKLNSPGPVLFSQIRCGLFGKTFRLWKFRSMIVNDEELKVQVENQIKDPFFKNRHDLRITFIGRFLRQNSLDKLPQFWNVLKGEMSLVGTRPPALDEVICYTIPMWQRLNVKPGLTGEWQTNGRSRIFNLEDVMNLDLSYQNKWSILYDFQLLFKTLLIIFKRNNDAK
ncbi:sugar transferase [Pleurocapsales cyanobacterium LEGE 10410]|nr:sugar transferase [Pleurocapsales cyanobacterium LEGE 10410]